MFLSTNKRMAGNKKKSKINAAKMIAAMMVPILLFAKKGESVKLAKPAVKIMVVNVIAGPTCAKA